VGFRGGEGEGGFGGRVADRAGVKVDCMVAF